MTVDEIKLDYGLAEDMVRTFQQGAAQLQTTLQAMQSVAQMLEGGALLGRGGSTFVDATRNNLCPSITRLHDKFKELEGDVQAAIQAMKDADKKSASMFSS